MTRETLIAATGKHEEAPATIGALVDLLLALETQRPATSKPVSVKDLMAHFRVSRARIATAIQRAKLTPITRGRFPRYDRAAALATLPPYLT